MKWTVLALALALPGTASAGPLAAFVDRAEEGMLRCRQLAEIAVVTASGSPIPATRCAATERADVMPLYVVTLSDVPAPAGDLLKEYYSLWRTAIDEVLPKPEEPMIVYRSRLSRSEQELSRLGQRLRLEE